MNRTYEITGSRMIAYMPREVDHHQAEELRKKWDMVIEGSHIKELIFDFSKTEFMDSSGIGVLIGRTRKIGYFGGHAYAMGLNDRVSRLFLAAGLNEMIPVVTLKIQSEENGKDSDKEQVEEKMNLTEKEAQHEPEQEF